MLIYRAAGVIRGNVKAFPAPFVSILIGLNSTVRVTKKRRSPAIVRWSFTALARMSSRVPAWPWRCRGGDLNAFDRLPVAFGLGANGASL